MTTINAVVSRYKKNVDWVHKLPNVTSIFIYDKETPENPYNVPINKGNEASVYLKHIVDYYDNLADFTFFIHDDEFAWHHSGSVVDKFNEAVASGLLYYNINDLCKTNSIVEKTWHCEIINWYANFVEKYIPIQSLPNADYTQGYRGAAQFLVHKSQITNLPKQFYKDLYNWVITTDVPVYKSGRFFEYTWHVWWDIYPNLATGNFDGFDPLSVKPNVVPLSTAY